VSRAVVLALAGVVACGGADAPRPTAAVRDSAGVRIVESSAPAWGIDAPWRVAARAEVEVGGVAGDSARDFAGVRSGARLADGRFVVADGGSDQLRLFDAKGAHLRTLGGRGDRESQFTALGAAFVRGDTIVAWDDRRQRVVRFSAEGAFLGSSRAALPDTTRLGRPAGLFGDGSLLLVVPTPVDVMQLESPVLRVPATLVRLGAVAAESVASMGSDEIVVRRNGRSASAMMRPFGLNGRVAVQADGFVVGDGSAHAFRRYASSGRLETIFRRPGARLPLLPADTAREHGIRSGAALTVREREAIDNLWRTVPFPDSLPAHGEIVPDPTGAVWVRELVRPGDGTSRYQVYGTDGTWLGAVELPMRCSLLWVGMDAVLVRRVDENEVEHVAVHRLRR
jgi:hypothetical protein